MTAQYGVLAPVPVTSTQPVMRVITPTALGAGSTHNYSPVDVATSLPFYEVQVIRQPTNAAGSTVTGLDATSVLDGQYVVIENLGPGVLTLAHESGSSTAANRFTLPNAVDMVIDSGGAVMLFRDATSARWRPAGVSRDRDRGIVSVRDYGAVGDGVTDDTTAWTNAIATGRTVVGRPGDTYILNGGLVASTAGQVIDMTGCVVKLKNSASSKTILRLNGARSRVVGGEWNMNAANNGTGDPYGHMAALLAADYAIAEGMYVHDSFGIGIKGTGGANYTEVRNCRVDNAAVNGIFFDGPTTADCVGTRVSGCTVTISATAGAVGIYIVSVAPYTYLARRWTIEGNTVIGPASASTSVGITGRGADGVVTGNHVRDFDIGISIDHSISLRTVVSNNRVEDNYAGYGGIEVNGADSVISGNFVRGSQYGIVGTTNAGTGASMDGRIIIGNRLLDQTAYAIYVGPASGDTARRQLIVGNTITASTHIGLIRLLRDCQYSLIEGNILRGNGSAGGRGVYLDTVPGNVAIRQNRFAALQRTGALFNNTATAYTNVSFEGNDVSEDIGAADTSWLALEGTATYGTGIRLIGNYTGDSNTPKRDIVNASTPVHERWSNVFSTPEGNFTAGVGSKYCSLSNGKEWVKVAGTGNTGWKPTGYTERLTPTYGATVSISTSGYHGQYDIVVTDGNAFTISNPTTPISGIRITIRVKNTSGGAVGAITWGTAYKLAAWTSPATGNSRAIEFQYDGTNWIEVSRTPADVPN